MMTVDLHMDNGHILSVEMDAEEVELMRNDFANQESTLMSFNTETGAEIMVPIRRVLYIEATDV